MKLKLSTLFAAAMLLLLTSCNQEEDNNKTLVPIHVNTNGFNVTQEDFESTRAATTADDYTNVNAIILAFYQGNTEIKRLSQLRDTMAEGENFGEFNLYLPIGKYTMVVVAYSTNENSPFTLTSLTEAAFTGLRVKDTFVATQTVNVTSGNPLALSATLNRIVSQLTVQIGGAGKFMLLCPPSSVPIDPLCSLYHLEQSGAPGNPIIFKGRGYGQADGFLRAGCISHHQIGIHGIQITIYTLHRSIEGFQIYGNITFL